MNNLIVENEEIKDPPSGGKEEIFPSADAELEAMFRAGLHFAYSRSRRHPKMSSYMYGIKNNVEVFELSKVRECLRSAEGFFAKIGERKGNILLVGTKPSVGPLVKEMGLNLNLPYVSERWVGGTLTNGKVIRERIKFFEDLKRKKESGELEKYTKKERLGLSRKIEALERYLGGIVNIKNDLDAIFIVDPKEEKTALHEALNVKLPIVAILSSDNDPSGILYPIPSNDTAVSSIAYITQRLTEAYRDGSRRALAS
ncbi:30S ribosomal protein S2 [Candidatus Giovannonibacteria bacterium]|nr:30S ribosomal protein S2 [Candidatus Giovannonibacteria bacterium]